MNKKQLAREIMENVDLSEAQASACIDAFTSNIKKSMMDNDRVILVGLGTFSVVNRAARTGRNPKTGEETKIPATISPKFKASRSLRDAIGGKDSKSDKKSAASTKSKTTKK